MENFENLSVTEKISLLNQLREKASDGVLGVKEVSPSEVKLSLSSERYKPSNDELGQWMITAYNRANLSDSIIIDLVSMVDKESKSRKAEVQFWMGEVKKLKDKR